MLNVGDFFARSFTDSAVEDEQLPVAEDHAAADESCVTSGLSVKDSRNLEDTVSNISHQNLC